MSAADGIDVAREGQRIKTKVLVALMLSSVVPALVLVYVLLVLALPTFLQILLGLTITGLLTGAWVHWDLGPSFNKMLLTIEQQAAEMNSFATRLDAAYREMESTNARLKEAAFRDDITSLGNRRYLLIRLEEEVGRWKRSSRPFSLVLFELSGLRAAGDTRDYADYEAALDTFARMLLVPSCSKGSVIARYDGSRFAALLLETPREGALRFVQMVRDTVASSHPNDQEMALKISVASPPDDGADAFELLSAADAALRRGLPGD